MATTGTEQAEITRVVNLYAEGVRDGDAAKLREAFHPQARMSAASRARAMTSRSTS